MPRDSSGPARKNPPIGDVVHCYLDSLRDGPLDVLERPSAAGIVNRSILLAKTWTNLAGALLDSDQTNIEDIRSAIHKALALLNRSEPTDAVSAEIGSKARHLLSRLAMKNMVTIPKT